MPLTRATVETVIVARMKRALTEAGMATTTTGGNSDLADPVATALEWYGVYPADRADPQDADLAPIADADVASFLDLVEIRALETALQNVLAQPRRESWEDYAVWREGSVANLESLIAAKRQAWSAKLTGGARATAMSPVVRGALRSPWACPGDPAAPDCC